MRLVFLVLLSLSAAVYLCLLRGTERRVDGADGVGKKKPHHRKRKAFVLADTHIAGPELVLNAESNPMDNVSVLRAMQRLYRVLDRIGGGDDGGDGDYDGAVTGADGETDVSSDDHADAPPLLLVLGDIVHDGLRALKDPTSLRSFERDLFERDVNGYTIARDLFAQSDNSNSNSNSVLFTFGNHDARTSCGDVRSSISDLSLLANVYQFYFNTTPWGATDDVDSNWTFVRLNGMWGETWRAGGAHCNTELASFGAEQLAWLDATLAAKEKAGRFVLVLTHFPLTATLALEAELGVGLVDVLKRHEGTVKGVLTGHFHKGISWGRQRNGTGYSTLPVVTLPAVRYSSENWFRLALDVDGTWEVEGFERLNKGGARCSRRRRGQDTDPDLYDEGDCGVPLVGDESDVRMDPVTSMDVYPSVVDFNPEGSCRWELAAPFFAACTPNTNTGGSGTGSDDRDGRCCQVLQEVFWPGSSHPFSTCLCMDAFWNAVVDRVFPNGGDQGLVDVLRRCDQQGTFLIWPRRRMGGDRHRDRDRRGGFIETMC